MRHAGHQVFLSSGHAEQLRELAARIGPNGRVGTPREAAAFGEAVLIAVPYGALPQVGRDYAGELKARSLETGNPNPGRDGDMAQRAGNRVAVPLAADDDAALKIAVWLVEDAGFAPVVVGPLPRARDFDIGTPVFARALTARELRAALGR